MSRRWSCAFQLLLAFAADEALAQDAFIRGDVNRDARLDVSDPVSLLSYLFAGATPPGCSDAADANDDGRLDVSDAVRVFDYLFVGGAPPPPPFPEANSDPTPDSLGCGGLLAWKMPAGRLVYSMHRVAGAGTAQPARSTGVLAFAPQGAQILATGTSFPLLGLTYDFHPARLLAASAENGAVPGDVSWLWLPDAPAEAGAVISASVPPGPQAEGSIVIRTLSEYSIVEVSVSEIRYRFVHRVLVEENAALTAFLEWASSGRSKTSLAAHGLAALSAGAPVAEGYGVFDRVRGAVARVEGTWVPIPPRSDWTLADLRAAPERKLMTLVLE